MYLQNTTLRPKHKSIDLTGQRFGRLIVVSIDPKRTKRLKWICQCDCGKQKSIRSDSLRCGVTKSCGCGMNEITHGASKTSEYKAWQTIQQKCYNPNDCHYKYYGARGIAVCDCWRNSFENFLADMGKRPSPQHSIDRIDVNGNYCPENCRWATNTEQSNNKRKNIYYEWQGVKQTIPMLARQYSINIATLYSRIKRGWSIEKALTTKTRKYHQSS